MSLPSKLISAAGWRLAHVVGKVTGSRSMVPWEVLWKEISTPWELAFEVPSFSVIESDPQDGLVLREGGPSNYWLPAEANLWGLGDMYREVFNPGQAHFYEYAGCRIRSGDVVIDAGACEGFFTRFALSRGAKVIVVEPWSKMVTALARTFAPEIEAGNVHLVRALLSGESKESKLQFVPEWPYGACQAGDAPSASASIEAVREKTVDEIIAESPWKRCDFLKMDIEGAETAAIEAATESLRRWRPAISLATYHYKSDYLAIRAQIRSLGLGYRVAGKGVIQMPDDPTWRPQLLHAWAR